MFNTGTANAQIPFVLFLSSYYKLCCKLFSLGIIFLHTELFDFVSVRIFENRQWHATVFLNFVNVTSLFQILLFDSFSAVLVCYVCESLQSYFESNNFRFHFNIAAISISKKSSCYKYFIQLFLTRCFLFFSTGKYFKSRLYHFSKTAFLFTYYVDLIDLNFPVSSHPSILEYFTDFCNEWQLPSRWINLNFHSFFNFQNFFENYQY